MNNSKTSDREKPEKVVYNGVSFKPIDDSSVDVTQNELEVSQDVQNVEDIDREDKPDDAFSPKEGGWGWVVCATSFWVNGTIFGILNTFGILYVALRQKYGETDPSISFRASLIGSVCIGVMFLACTLSGMLCDKFGIRKTAIFGTILGVTGLLVSAFVDILELMYLTYGIILGTGAAMVYNPSLVILGHYFKKRIGIVNGFVTFGSSLFSVVLSFAIPELLQKVGLKWTLVFQAGMYLMLLPCVLTWKPQFNVNKTKNNDTKSKESNTKCISSFVNLNIWKNKLYVLWVVSHTIPVFGYFVPFVHLVKHSNDLFPNSNGNLLIMCLNITSGVGRILFGKIADHPKVRRIVMQPCAFAVFGLITLCIPFANNFYSLVAVCLCLGLADGSVICLDGAIAFDIVGPKDSSQAIGNLLAILSIPVSVGPPIAGVLYDHFGDYRVAFHLAGIPPLLSIVCLYFIVKTQQKVQTVKNKGSV